MYNRSQINYVTMIGDMKDSRLLVDDRDEAQEQLKKILAEANDNYRKQILSPLTITAGDEFQAVLTEASVVPDILWDIETQFTYTKIRFGFGHGTFYTKVNSQLAIGMDGESWYNARDSIIIAKKKRLFGGVFQGFDNDDKLLNGLARLLYQLRQELNEGDIDVFRKLRKGMRQTDVAKENHKTRQEISFRAKRAGWQAYNEGEEAWRYVLRRYPNEENEKL